jgi:serine/threonine protein kinase
MNETGAAPVRPGDLLAGKYRVERILGVGGMGIVVAARHEQLDQMVAIKFVREEALLTEDGAERFLREARASVKLKSEHVARVLDVGKLESGAPYMVMELLEGSDLGEVLETSGPLSFEMAAALVLQACEAVAEAHAAGIVHRDLKPQNLFLTRTVGGSPKLKVLDFGVSKAIGLTSGGMGALTRTRAMLGSPLYMAPEQMRSSRDVDARADIWALGVVLFELLTGRWPFEAETMPELCLKVVTDPPQSLAALRPETPPEFVALIECCLEKDPARRFANAAELATGLEPFVPPASRILAEHARLALQTGPRLQGPPRAASTPTHVPTLASHEAPRAPSLPSGWGGSLQASASRAGGHRRVVGWSIGAVVVAAVAALLLVLLGRREPSPRALAAPPAASDSAPAAVAAQPAASVVSLPPAPTFVQPSAVVRVSPPAESTASSALVPLPRSAAPARPTGAPVRAASPRGSARPGAADDDIPALR